MEIEEEEKETYIGDAVYASHDGYQIKLRTGDGNNQIIYLDSRVWSNLVDYVESLRKKGADLPT